MNDFLQSLRNGQAEKQRTPKTRKNSDNSYHYSSGPRYNSYGGGYQNNRNQQMKRPQSSHPGNHLPVDEGSNNALLADAVETLGDHIETLAKNQEYLINAQERTADMMERQAIAIERIVSYLNIAPASDYMPEEMPDTPERSFEHHYVTSPTPEPEPVIKNPEPVEKVVKPVKKVIRRRKKIAAKQPEKTSDKSNNKLLSREEVMDIIHTMRADGATFDQVAGRLVELGQPTFSGRGEWHAQTIHRLCNKK